MFTKQGALALLLHLCPLILERDGAVEDQPAAG